MIRFTKAVVYYALFAVLSATLHAIFLVPMKRVPDRPKMADLAKQIQLQIAEIEKMLPPEPPASEPAKPPPPPPEPPKPEPTKPEPVKYKETPRPLEKTPEPEPVQKTDPPKPEPPKPEPPKPEPPKEEPRPEPPKEEPKPEPAKPEPAPPEPAPSRVEEPKPEPAKTEPAPAKAEEPPKPKAEITSLTDYRRFLSREMKSEGANYAYVPKLRFGDDTAEDNRAIMRYFGMELIAYPKSQKFYVYVDPEQGLYSRSSDYNYLRNFSNRVIYRSSPYFDKLRQETAKHVGLDANALVMAQLLKPASAAYIAWKEAESAKRAGVALDDVEACDATFAKTPFGAWIVRIDGLAMKDGRTIRVQDFEWARVSAANGGGK